MNNKKIAIVTRQMVMGGIEKSLISLLKSIPSDKFDITVFVMARGGDLFNDIPEYVNVKSIYGEYNSNFEKIKNNLQNNQYIKALKNLYYILLAVIYRKFHHFSKEDLCQLKIAPRIRENFDIAISYHTPASIPVIYVIDNLKAKKKLAWIHSDISVYEKELIRYEKYYHKFDKIYCVSKFAQTKFIDKYPKLKHKVDVFYNIIDKYELYDLSNKYNAFKDSFDGIRLLTVGRLTEEKGQDLIPDIIKMLLDDNLNLRWYLIGDGEEKENLEYLIKKNNLADRIILLGTIVNPYPYFKECDIYVQPSRHEGYCITLAEARLFNKAIVTTDSVGAKEQIVDGETGLIVKFDKFEIYNAIKKIIENKQLGIYITDNLKKDNLIANSNDSLRELLNI